MRLPTMDSPLLPRSRRRLTMFLAFVGLAIAAAFATYFETNPKPESTVAVYAGIASFVLCPGSLLFVSFIDAEPGTGAFLFMWLVIGLVNLGLYGAIGALIGRLRWKVDPLPPKPA